MPVSSQICRARHVHAVVTDDAARGHQHRRELRPDVLDGETRRRAAIRSARPVRPVPALRDRRAGPQPRWRRYLCRRPPPQRIPVVMTRPLLEGLPPIADDARADAHSRQHAQRDVAGGAAVLRQPAQRVLADHRRHLRVRRRIRLRRAHRRAAWPWRRGLGCAAAVPTTGQPRFGDRAGQHGGQRLRARSSTRIPRSIGSSSTARRRRRTSSASPGSTGPLRYRRLPSTSPAQTMRYADKLAMWREALG